MKKYAIPYAKCNTCCRVLGKVAIKNKATRKCCFSSFVIHYGFNTACQKYGIMDHDEFLQAFGNMYIPDSWFF